MDVSKKRLIFVPLRYFYSCNAWESSRGSCIFLHVCVFLCFDITSTQELPAYMGCGGELSGITDPHIFVSGSWGGSGRNCDASGTSHSTTQYVGDLSSLILRPSPFQKTASRKNVANM